MERLLACRASLARELLVCADDGVANGTLGLAFERTLNILLPGDDAIDNVPVLFINE